MAAGLRDGQPVEPGDTLVVGDPVVALGSLGVLRDGALVLRDGEIVWAGPRAEAPAPEEFGTVLGSPAHAVLPGFVNGHYHSEVPLDRFLFETGIERYSTGWHAQSAMPITEEALYDAVLSGLIACAEGGQTGIVDMYYGNPGLPNFGADAALQAYDDLGIRTAFGLCTRDRNVYVHGPDEDFLCRLARGVADEVRRSSIGYAWPVADVLDTFEHLTDRWDDPQGRIRVIPAPDWTPCCSDELYLRCAELAREHRVPLTSHVLESRYEMAASQRLHGRSPVERLAALGVLDAGLTCAHAVWLTRQDITLLAASRSVVSHNPSSNLRTSQGIAPVREVLDAGGRFVVGTDGLSFSGREDYLVDLRLAAYLQRRPRNLTDARIPSLALLGSLASAGAQALGQEGRLGSLEPGRRADLILLRTDRALAPRSLTASWDPLDALLDRSDMHDIELVMVDGRVIVRDGEVLTVDATAVLARHADEVARRESLLGTRADLRREFIELPALLDPHVVAYYHDELLKPLPQGEPYNAAGPP